MSKTTQPPCPYCQHPAADRVSGVAPALRDDVLFRRHRCAKCKRAFTSAQVALTPAMNEKVEAVLDD